eukprot:756362-Hanusia_phi.AAC.1
MSSATASSRPCLKRNRVIGLGGPLLWQWSDSGTDRTSLQSEVLPSGGLGAPGGPGTGGFNGSRFTVDGTVTPPRVAAPAAALPGTPVPAGRAAVAAWAAARGSQLLRVC